jgi:predicted ATPase
LTACCLTARLSVQALLTAAPNAKILATSQTPLGLAVEQTLLLPPLPIPPDTRLSNS